MWVQGIPLTTLSTRLNIPLTTLGKWSKKERWATLRAKYEGDQAAVHKTVLEKHAEMARNGAAEDLAESVRNLRATPQSADLDSLGKRARVLNDIVGAGSKLFGWGQEGKGAQLFAVTGFVAFQEEPRGLDQSASVVDAEQVAEPVGSISAVAPGADLVGPDEKHALPAGEGTGPEAPGTPFEAPPSQT